MHTIHYITGDLGVRPGQPPVLPHSRMPGHSQVPKMGTGQITNMDGCDQENEC